MLLLSKENILLSIRMIALRIAIGAVSAPVYICSSIADDDTFEGKSRCSSRFIFTKGPKAKRRDDQRNL